MNHAKVGTSGRRSSLASCLPDGAGGRRQGAHGVSHVIWNVDGQRGDLGLHRLHRGLRGFAFGFLAAGERRKRDLDIGAGEAEGAPAGAERRVVTRSMLTTQDSANRGKPTILYYFCLHCFNWPISLKLSYSVMSQRVSKTPDRLYMGLNMQFFLKIFSESKMFNFNLAECTKWSSIKNLTSLMLLLLFFQ